MRKKYKFTGKERDKESGLDYFSGIGWLTPGARYYDSEIGRWLSVDPLAAKYPGWSPYNYCMNNPLGNVDPNGMAADVYINGDDANEAIDELQKETKNLKITRDQKTGILSYSGKPKTDLEKSLVNAIDDELIVSITTTSDHFDNYTHELFFGGSFRGSGLQTININDFPSLSKLGVSSIGESIAHEIIETHKGAELAADISDNSITLSQAFDISHNAALKVIPDKAPWKVVGSGKSGWQVTNKQSNQSVVIPFTSHDKEFIDQKYGKQ